ncbi:hypothetical protein ABK040_005073 [Willaertia magna]
MTNKRRDKVTFSRHREVYDEQDTEVNPETHEKTYLPRGTGAFTGENNPGPLNDEVDQSSFDYLNRSNYNETDLERAHMRDIKIINPRLHINTSTVDYSEHVHPQPGKPIRKKK